MSEKEKTLNELLAQKADQLTSARRYERNKERTDTRAGSYKRKLFTKVGEVTLKVSKLRTLTFETPIIQQMVWAVHSFSLGTEVMVC